MTESYKILSHLPSSFIIDLHKKRGDFSSFTLSYALFSPLLVTSVVDAVKSNRPWILQQEMWDEWEIVRKKSEGIIIIIIVDRPSRVSFNDISKVVLVELKCVQSIGNSRKLHYPTLKISASSSLKMIHKRSCGFSVLFNFFTV